MLNTFYHRSQIPWVYQKENGKIQVSLRIGKNLVEKIEAIYGDSLGPYIKGQWFKKYVNMKISGETKLHEIWTSEMDNKTKRYRYAFKITFKNGKTHLMGEVGELKDENAINFEGNGFTHSYWSQSNMLNTPEWFRHTNWFQIFPDRFNKSKNQKGNFKKWNEIKPNGHELYGGDITGIIEKLNYIKDLGFSGIYLTPIFEATSSHRYDTKNYYKIDPILGSEEDFKLLVKKAHKLGLKIMLDAVFNHMGYAAKPWQDVLKNKEKSKYKEWFWINDMNGVKSPQEYWYSKEKGNKFQDEYPFETFAFVPGMPRIKWDNPDARKYLLGAARKWTKMGIDGWRLDVSYAPSNDFWRAFMIETKKINSKIAIIGEVWWDSINWLNGDMWHGVMNYPLRNIIIDFVSSEQNMSDKEQFVFRFNELAFMYTPEQQWGMFNLLSSHDIVRAITLLKNDEEKYKQALSIMYLQPGATSTYYGEEIGLEGEHGPDNRRPMPWGEIRIDFKKFIKNILNVRNKFVNTSSIYDRYIARLDRDIIIISNNTNKITIDDKSVKREAKND